MCEHKVKTGRLNHRATITYTCNGCGWVQLYGVWYPR